MIITVGLINQVSIYFLPQENHIDVKVSVLSSSVVYRGFECRSGQTKTMKLVFVASPLSTQHYRERAKTGWLGIMIMCPSGATGLSVDCCLSELAL